MRKFTASFMILPKEQGIRLALYRALERSSPALLSESQEYAEEFQNKLNALGFPEDVAERDSLTQYSVTISQLTGTSFPLSDLFSGRSFIG